jgi:hypothetical protein
MISSELRAWLTRAAMVILVLGPIVAILYPVLSVPMNEMGISTAIGIGVRSLLGSAFLGGVLRLLVSIDARLEARA